MRKADSSSSGSSSSETEDGKVAVDVSEEAEGKVQQCPRHSLLLPPPEEGIMRFEFSAEEKGPLGLSFSGGFPPLILAVLPGSHASTKGMPAMHEVHAINGLALVQQNGAAVMKGLKSRPVTVDVRPQGWRPMAKIKELERQREREDAEKRLVLEEESKRREQVSQEQRERDEREFAAKLERQERERGEYAEAQLRAREALREQLEREDSWNRKLNMEPVPFRKAADELMAAEYGSSVNMEGGKRLPLRLLTRRKEVAWLWAGEVQELIGGGIPDGVDSWS